MKTFFSSVNGVKTMVNGQIVEDSMLGTRYDGNTLAIDTYNTGKKDHIELDNKDIMKIMSRPASAMSLEQRLMRDFGMKTNRRKTNRRKTNRRKTNRKKTNRKKTNRRKTNRRKTNRK
jgi:hypothetical protein